MDLIAAAATEVDASGGGGFSPLVKGSLRRMTDLGNVPRNEKKFKNFLSNSLRVRGVVYSCLECFGAVGADVMPPAWPAPQGGSRLTNNDSAYPYTVSRQIHRPQEQDELWQFLRKRAEAANAAAADAAATPAAATNGKKKKKKEEDEESQPRQNGGHRQEDKGEQRSSASASSSSKKEKKGKKEKRKEAAEGSEVRAGAPWAKERERLDGLLVGDVCMY